MTMKIYIIQKGEHSDRHIIEITDDKKKFGKEFLDKLILLHEADIAAH